MITTNWWKDAAHSDSEGYSTTGPTPTQYLDYTLQLFNGLSTGQQQQLFAGTAQIFYKLWKRSSHSQLYILKWRERNRWIVLYKHILSLSVVAVELKV